MGKETKARASEELWHLGIADLLMSSAEPGPAAVSGPFVIHLRTSSTPISQTSNALQRFKRLHVYQLERRHEGRPQFLLRVGIIESNREAETVLATLREDYPGAFKASAGDDDRRAVVARTRVAAPARTAARKSEPGRSGALPTPRTAPAAKPAVAADPTTPFRWNIDEVLPELGAKRQSTPGRQPPNRGTAQPRRAVTPAARAATGPAQTPRNPAQSTPPRPAMVPTAPAPLPSATTRLRPSSIAAPPPPSAAKAAPPRPTDEGPDCDPNAVTDQVESPVLAFEAPRLEADAPPPSEVEPPAAEIPTLGAALDPTTTEVQVLAPSTLEQASLEVVAVAAQPVPGSTTEAAGDAALAEPERESASVPAPEPLAAAAAAPPLFVPVEAAEPAAAQVRIAPEPSPCESMPTEAPQIDHTQSIRALTSLELEDGQSSQSFAIQLMLSEEEIDPHEVPNLSIFAEYRLYAVTGLDQGRLLHALRLGFFSSETAAAAVAGYLGTFFDAPCIKRVSIAEHERFEERRVRACKDVAGMDEHDVIELAGPAPSPLRQTDGQLPAPEKHDAPRASSIWSRLIPTRK